MKIDYNVYLYYIIYILVLFYVSDVSYVHHLLQIQNDRVVMHWHRLLREVVDAPSLETFKARLVGALSNLIQLKMSLTMAGGVGLDDL